MALQPQGATFQLWYPRLLDLSLQVQVIALLQPVMGHHQLAMALHLPHTAPLHRMVPLLEFPHQEAMDMVVVIDLGIEVLYATLVSIC